MKKRTLLLLMSVVLSTIVWAQKKELTLVVSNPDRMQRQEVVGVSVIDVYHRLGVKTGTPLVVKNALGQEVASQVTYDGLLLMDAAVRPRGTAKFTVAVGQPSAISGTRRRYSLGERSHSIPHLWTSSSAQPRTSLWCGCVGEEYTRAGSGETICD